MVVRPEHGTIQRFVNVLPLLARPPRVQLQVADHQFGRVVKRHIKLSASASITSHLKRILFLTRRIDAVHFVHVRNDLAAVRLTGQTKHSLENAIKVMSLVVRLALGRRSRTHRFGDLLPIGHAQLQNGVEQLLFLAGRPRRGRKDAHIIVADRVRVIVAMFGGLATVSEAGEAKELGAFDALDIGFSDGCAARKAFLRKD